MKIEDNTFSWDDFDTEPANVDPDTTGDDGDGTEGTEGDGDGTGDDGDDEGLVVNNPDDLEVLGTESTTDNGEDGEGTEDAGDGEGDGSEGDGEGDGEGSGTDGMSGIELYLSSFDIEGGMIQFDDGSSKHFNDLDPEKQSEILAQLHSTQATSVQDQYGLDENEVGLINYLRTNKVTVEDMVDQLAEERAQRILALQQVSGEDYNDMSDDAVYIKMIKRINPEATDEQVEEELETAKKLSGFGKQADYFRQQFIGEQTQAVTQQQLQQQQALQQELEQDRALIVNSTAGLKEISGIELSDDMKNSIYDRILSVNEHNDTLFLEDATTDPKNLFKAAFWFYNGEDVVKQLNDYWKKEKSAAYKRGREEALGSGSGEKVSFVGSKVQQQTAKTTPQHRNESHGDDSFFFED